jgi:large subunit ribosomal protein L27
MEEIRSPNDLVLKFMMEKKITAGSIVVRQRGTKIHPGENVSKGGDDTLFAKADGVIKFSTRNGRKLINVIPQ